MTDIVFLGPSLDLEQARALCAADYRPPARMGDVYRAACERPRSITIIDGLFERVPAVWHKEILYALDRGIRVYGGSSMGALRAAELAAFGMVGIGAIFRDFASGVLSDDDEVAVAHASADLGYLCASVAMVNLRSGLAAAVAAGLLDDDEAAALIAAAKARFYPERSWEALYADALASGMAAERVAALRAWVEATRPDQKRDDAIAVLRTLAQAPQQTSEPPRVPFVFEHTVYWETVETYSGRHGSDAAGSQFERVRNHARLFEPDREQLLDRALLLFLAEQEARRLRLRRSDDRAALTAFRTRRGLESTAALTAWLEHNRIGKDECLALARLESYSAALRDRHIAVIDRYLAPTLKLEGRYAGIASRVAGKWQVIAQMEIGQINEQDVAAFDEVLAWYQQHHGRVATSLEQHAAALGMGSLHQWREELFAEYLASTQSA